MDDEILEVLQNIYAEFNGGIEYHSMSSLINSLTDYYYEDENGYGGLYQIANSSLGELSSISTALTNDASRYMQKVTAIKDTLSDISTKLDSLDGVGGSGGEITLVDDQWDVVQAHFERMEYYGQNTLVCVVLCMCMICALLGARIWDVISRRWAAAA